MTASGSDRVGVDITLESSRFDCDRLRVAAVSGGAAISRVDAVDVEVVALDGVLDVAEVLGEDVAIVFTPHDLDADGGAPGDAWRGVHRLRGMIVEVDDRVRVHAEGRSYRFKIVPRLERLALSSGQEIFLGMTVPEIIQRKLASAHLVTEGGAAADVVLRLEGTYDARDFVVQYQETDLAFISRLAEHLGIAWFFLDDGDVDQLVLTDHASGFRTETQRIPFTDHPNEACVFALEAKHRVVPRTHTIHDYNYRAPHVEVLATQEVGVGYAGDVVEYGAHMKTPQAAAGLARVRSEERAATQLVYEGKSSIAALRPGMRVCVIGHPDFEETELLVVEVHHDLTQALGNAGKVGKYTNTFRAIPGDRMYRPPRTTPKPRIAGVINGVIDPGVGGSGANAMLDDQGRYRVRFLFDTTDRQGQHSSHPVRMLQNHAGENYGTHFPLKPGIEVLVAFVDGDPDRPVIVGAAANPLTPSPVTGENQNIHRIKSIRGTVIDFT